MSGKDADQEQPFFIGYMPTPRALAGFYLALVPIVAGVAIGIGVAFAAAQDDPGEGRFIGRATLTGIVTNEPYPVLYALETDDNDRPGSVMLTGPGKVGAMPRTDKFEGQLVEMTGAFIARGEIRIFQVGRVKASERILTPEEEAFLKPKKVKLDQHALNGEIVDSKCYLGAMRPGEGKVHMACANYCMHGGIPPVFVTYQGSDLNGEATYFLMAGPDGKAIDPDLMNYTSLAVTATGDVERRGDLHILKVTPASVELFFPS